MRTTALAITLAMAPAISHAVTISSYDMTDAAVSGSGGWENHYTGTSTPAGSSATSYGSAFGLDNRTGGSGTLNDGVLGTGAQNTHLLSTADNVVISLFFDAVYTLSNISLFSYSGGNSIPGSITGFDAVWSGGSATYSTTQDSDRTEFADFTGSPLDGIQTSSLTLRNFTTNGQFFDLFAISEIALSGTSAPVAPVPLPAPALLLAGGLFGLAGLRRRKKSHAAL